MRESNVNKPARFLDTPLSSELASAAKAMLKRPSFRAERTIWGEGALLIAGVDEVGRGPLAGPVAAGAVILPREVRIAGRYRFLRHVNDSKKLTSEAREELAPLIWERAVTANV